MRFSYSFLIILFAPFSNPQRLRRHPASIQRRLPPVTETFQGPNAPIKLSPDARNFKTRLQDAAKQSPLAGHYIVTYWGCGTGCRDTWIVDAKTGKASSLPFTIVSFPGDDPKAEALQYQVDSKLLIIRGHLNEAEKGGTYYYKWENDKLVPIQSNTN